LVFSHALDIPVNNFCLSNNSQPPSFFMTETGIDSTLS